MGYVKALDGIRGLAILGVILFHFGYLKVGWVGVQVFFVLSGFLITSILVNEKGLPLSDYLKRFYWRRSVRIFPLYFAYLSLVAVTFVVTGAPETFGSQWLHLITYTFNFLRSRPDYANSEFLGHFWSLCVEEQFYLFWPLFIYWVSQRNLGMVISAILIAGPIGRAFTAEYFGRQHSFEAGYLGQAVYSVTWSHLDAFASGALVAVSRRQEQGGRGLLPVALSVLMVGIAGMMNTWLLKGHFVIDTSLGFPINMIRHGQHIWGYTLVNLSSAALVMVCTAENWVARLFQVPWLLYTGKISYGLYVYHLAIQAFTRLLIPVHPRSALGVLAFCVHLAILFAVAHLSYRFFERRFLRLKDKHFQRS